MLKRSSKRGGKRRDINELAAGIVAATTEPRLEPEREKNPAAVALGRLGGLKGGKARASKLSSDQRTTIAKKAARARWSKPQRG